MRTHDVLVAIPTYNERENVPLLYAALKNLSTPVDILFIDDNSPDGTGTLINTLRDNDPIVTVIHRPKKMGLGTAHLEAFKVARSKNYTHLITMDADFTHHPSYIPDMLETVMSADIVIGSRYTHGGSMSGWGSIRLPFTYFWRGMIKYCLAMPYDCTGAFRAYNVSFLTDDASSELSSNGFSFCMESLYFFKKSGARIKEIPIKAQNRIHGTSKLSGAIMAEVAGVFFRLLVDRTSGLFRRR